MMLMAIKLQMKLQSLFGSEDGQDLVEYGLITALLAFGWVMGVKSLATALNSAFNGISTTLGSYIS
jgi:Flp pilus assembly pilin Flp